MSSIVAVHGLNPLGKEEHAVNTWQSSSGHLWLRDAFPQKQPMARILLYKYDSSPVFSADRDRFIFHANDLLERILIKRDDNRVRNLWLEKFYLDDHNITVSCRIKIDQ
jgi:hypothetical protein